jgi:hypothetical protein
MAKLTVAQARQNAMLAIHEFAATVVENSGDLWHEKRILDKYTEALATEWSQQVSLRLAREATTKLETEAGIFLKS